MTASVIDKVTLAFCFWERARAANGLSARQQIPEKETSMKRFTFALICASLMMTAAAPHVQAQSDPIEAFYRGKTLRMLIGYGPGGGYDLYGRLAAEFLPRFIPGNPLIIPQNMPGGGSFVAAK